MENVDWESCIICSKSGGDLRCPVDSFQNNAIDVYNKFLEAVKEFSNLNALPIDLKFEGKNKVKRVKGQRGKKRECDDQRKSRRKLDSCVNEESCIFVLRHLVSYVCATMKLDCDL